MSKRKGSRKGSEYDLIDNIISVAEREYGDLEDLTRTQADKVCETVAGMTGESVENVKAQLREMDELNGVTRQSFAVVESCAAAVRLFFCRRFPKG